MLRTLFTLAVSATSALAQVQPNCGAIVESNRVALESSYRSGRMRAEDYYAQRVRIEESAAACRAGQAISPGIQATPVQPQSAPPPGISYQTTPQGLHIPTPTR
jgi:hypothetical protein